MKTTQERLRNLETGQRILNGYARDLADKIDGVDKDISGVGSFQTEDGERSLYIGIRKGLCIAADVFLGWTGERSE